jgi:hypothetical protein
MVTLELLVPKVQQELKDLPEFKAQQEQQETLGLQEPKDQLAFKDQQEQQAQQVQQDQ